MFAGLKNKIKEETGSDVSRISSLVGATPGKASKGRHSRHGSTTSLGSFTIDGTKEEDKGVLDIKLADGRVLTPKEFKRLESKEDEWRKKLQKKDEEYSTQLKRIEDTWKKKLDDKEKELTKLLDSKDNENRQLALELKGVQLVNESLQAEVKQKDEYKSKLCQYQEDLDQLEGFQTQEIAKVKHLLLEKEQKLVENEKEILQLKQQVEDLSGEVRRLQQSNRELHNLEGSSIPIKEEKDRLEELRHKSDQEKGNLISRLAAEEENSRHLKDRLAVLDARCRAGCAGLGAELTVDERIQGLLGERTLLERLLAEAHEHLAEVKTTWSGTISSLETQVGRLCRQASEESEERRLAEQARDDLTRRTVELETTLNKTLSEIVEKDSRISEITEERNKLEEEIKNLNNKLEELTHSLVEPVVIRSNVEEEAESTQSITDLEKDNAILTKALKDQKENSTRLLAEFAEMKDLCEAEKRFSEMLRTDVGHERREKDAMMLRNAEVSQEIELVRQELRSFRAESNEMQLRIDELKEEIKNKDESLARERSEKDELLERMRNVETVQKDVNATQAEKEQMKATIDDLESQLQERNKTIKSLQMRVNDMKKTLQRELNVPCRAIDPGGQNGAGIIPPHGPALLTPSCPEDVEDVNFKYLKHVLFKFLTSREYEAQHLTRAVATLLRFSAEEERLLKETMDWKMSWFGSRPKVGSNLLSRSMPPS